MQKNIQVFTTDEIGALFDCEEYLGIDLTRLSKIHVAIVKRGITQFEYVSESYYTEELWSQIKVVTDSAFALAEIVLNK